MYGASETSAVSGMALAVTGLTMGTWVLSIAGVIFIGIGLWMLFRKSGEHRP